ncbi:hypothetical protein FMM68_02460 [Lachnospiraceae bacterium MD329]|nr:hypothetical protein [Lachnospiraceae bacterium MD329]
MLSRRIEKVKKLSNSLSGALVQNNIISADREKQCQYGLELMLSSMAEILFVILLSVFNERKRRK